MFMYVATHIYSSCLRLIMQFDMNNTKKGLALDTIIQKQFTKQIILDILI